MRRAIAMLAGALVSLAGCSGVPGADPSAVTIDAITVGVGDGGEPKLDYPIGGDFAKVESRIEWEGDGEKVVDGDPVLLDLYSESLATGNVIVDTYVELPQAYLMAPELLGQELYDALLGHRVGTRILLVLPEEPTHPALGPVAIVADVLPSQAVGVTQATEDDMPFVVSGVHGAPSLTFREDTDLPTDLASAVVIQGDGPQIHTGSRVLLNYLEVSATTRETVASTWPLETGPWGVTVGQGQMPTGLEQSLIDVAQGSRIIVIVPPVEGYGDDRLIFVVDVLAVRDPV